MTQQSSLVQAAATAGFGACIAIASAIAYSRWAAPPLATEADESEHTTCEPSREQQVVQASFGKTKRSRPRPRRKGNAGASNVHMIALTGGPCGGKSTCLNQLVKRLQEHQFNVLIAPEMPTLLKQMCECPFPFVPNAWPSDSLHMLCWEGNRVRLQLDLVINRNVFLKVPFFSNLDVTQITVIVPRIQHEYVWPAKVVVYEGLLSPGLYTVVRGFAKTTSGGTLQGLLTHADFFGEESLLSDAPAPLTTQAVSQCQFMILDREDFADVLELYPKIHTALVRHQRLKDKSTKTPTAKRQTMIQQLQKARRRAASPDLADLAASRLHHH